jgi:hypothetical protein
MARASRTKAQFILVAVPVALSFALLAVLIFSPQPDLIAILIVAVLTGEIVAGNVWLLARLDREPNHYQDDVDTIRFRGKDER